MRNQAKQLGWDAVKGAIGHQHNTQHGHFHYKSLLSNSLSLMHTHAHTPSLCLSLVVCLFHQSSYFPLFCLQVFCSGSSLFICVSFTTLLFLTLSCSDVLQPLSLLCLSRLMLYSHFPKAPTPFLFLLLCLLFCPQFPLSLYPPPSLFHCLSLTPSLPASVQHGHWNLQPNKDPLRKMATVFQRAVQYMT